MFERVIPEYYSGEKPGQGRRVARMRSSMKTLTPEYSTRRMLRDYVTQYYRPISAR